MKKLLVSLFIIGIGFAFVACNAESEQAVALESNDQVFTLEALSGASLLDYSYTNTVSFVPLSDEITTTEPVTTTTSDDALVEDNIDGIDQYLDMVKNFLGDNEGLSVNELISDRAEWDNMVSFTTVDILGNEITYIMYFNETLYTNEVTDDQTTTEVVTTEPITTESATTEPETTADSTTLSYTLDHKDQNQNFYFQDDDDNNVTYALTGLIVAGDLEYNVEGKRIIEDNGTEVLRLRSFIDHDNFVKIAYKTDSEDGNRKFFFEVVEAGQVVSKSSVKVMEEAGKLKVFMQTTENGDSATYVFQILDLDDSTVIHIMYNIRYADGTKESGNIHIVGTIDPVTGEIVYEYKILGTENGNKNNYKKIIEKRHENHDHDKSDKRNDNSKNL